MAAEVPPPRYALEKVLETPAPITSLTFGHAGHLFAGSGKLNSASTIDFQPWFHPRRWIVARV